MLSDDLCAISWRARPRSFVSLMTLYESNYIRFGWLAPEPSRITERAVSRVAGDCALELTVMERARYTTMLALSYLFKEGARELREPGLRVRLYHDARLAEATGIGAVACHPALRRVEARSRGAVDSRWSRNVLLNKWLEYCAERGHRFVAVA
jgi:uncharacterized protein YqiB (DUF1249 family)